MATIWKCDDKFMAKDYEVKLSEIFPIDDQIHTESETNGEDDGNVVKESNVTENGTGTSEDKSDDSNVEELAVVDVNGNDPETGIESQLATRNGNDVTGNLWMQ